MKQRLNALAGPLRWIAWSDTPPERRYLVIGPEMAAQTEGR